MSRFVNQSVSQSHSPYHSVRQSISYSQSSRSDNQETRQYYFVVHHNVSVKWFNNVIREFRVSNPMISRFDNPDVHNQSNKQTLKNNGEAIYCLLHFCDMFQPCYKGVSCFLSDDWTAVT